MNPRPYPVWTIFLGVSALTLTIMFLSFVLWEHSARDLPAEELKILRLVHRQILAEHVKDHRSEKLLENAIRAMVKDLDRHSRFISEDEVAAFEADEITGTYEGIGVLMVNNHSPATIRFPLSGGPAETAGLRCGDRIVAVDGEDIRDVPDAKIVETAIKLIKGPAGTLVKLTIERGDGAPFDVEVKRADVRQPAVKWSRLVDAEHGLGYVHIADFQQNMVLQFDQAIEDLEAANGGKLNGLILDLRFNPGGLLAEAIALCNRFIQKGTIVSLKRRGGEVVEQHKADPERCTIPGMSIIVLMNGFSASASEIVAGCLQDYAIARVVGVRSYGKGVVQSIYQWGDLPFRLKLTTSHYYTPKGRNIEARMRRKEDGPAEGGIAPDLEVTIDKAEKRRIMRSLNNYEVPARHAADARRVAEQLAISFPEPVALAEDQQLSSAIEELLAMIAGDTAAGTATKTGSSTNDKEDR